MRFLAVLLFFVGSLAHASASRTVDADAFRSSDTTKTWTPPSTSQTLVGRTSTDTLSNKTLDTSNVWADSSDPTKTLQFSPGSNNTGVNLTISTSQSTSQALNIPNVGSGDQIVTRLTTQTLQGKTISGANNTLQQVPISSNMVQDTFVGNGSTTTITFSNTGGTPSSDGMQCFVDGVTVDRGVDFTYTGGSSTATFTTAPAAGQKIKCVYSKY